MSNTPTFRQCLRPVDVLVIAFAVLLCFINLFSMELIHDWAILIGINIISCFGIAIISYLSETRTSKLIRGIHNWYPVPTIFLVFKEMYVIIQSIAHPDWDPLLIRIDHGMFGADPTVWLGMHASPVLTEILQIAYVSYYFIMLTVGIELFLRNEREKFSYIVFVIVYGFFLSYLGYLAVPAVGPRFTLHDFSALKSELPGLWLTNGLRDFIDAGESIPNNVSNTIRVCTAGCVSQRSHRNDADLAVSCISFQIKIPVDTASFRNIAHHQYRLPPVSLRDRCDRWNGVHAVHGVDRSEIVRVVGKNPPVRSHNLLAFHSLISYFL